MTNPRIHLEDLLTRRQDLAPLAESIWSAYTVTEAAYASGKAAPLRQRRQCQ